MSKPSITHLAKLWEYRILIIALTKREIMVRYRGSFLGISWFFLMPLFMLSIFSFFFVVIMRGDLGSTTEGGSDQYVMLLFCGLIIHGFFTEILTKAPRCIADNPNFVKKIRFPLEILPIIVVLSALIQILVGIFFLTVINALIYENVHLGFLWVPLILAPFLIFSAGVSLFLAAVGTFFKDIQQLTGIIGTALLFISPIFFSVEALPNWVQRWIYLNPLTLVVEALRSSVIHGVAPDIQALSIYLLVGVVTWVSGFALFNQCRAVFADVL